jgi:hypothetical protein
MSRRRSTTDELPLQLSKHILFGESRHYNAHINVSLGFSIPLANFIYEAGAVSGSHYDTIGVH